MPHHSDSANSQGPPPAGVNRASIQQSDTQTTSGIPTTDQVKEYARRQVSRVRGVMQDVEQVAEILDDGDNMTIGEAFRRVSALFKRFGLTK